MEPPVLAGRLQRTRFNRAWLVDRLRGADSRVCRLGEARIGPVAEPDRGRPAAQWTNRSDPSAHSNAARPYDSGSPESKA